MSTNCKTILIFSALILAFLLIAMLFPIRTHSQRIETQIVLKFERTENGARFFTSASRIALGLVPLNNAAPLSPQTLSVCKVEIVPLTLRSFEGKDLGTNNEILFRCGQDRYLFTTLAIVKE